MSSQIPRVSKGRFRYLDVWEEVPRTFWPYTVCKLYGAARALAHIKRNAVIIHGPKGCYSNVLNCAFFCIQRKSPYIMVSTQMSEEDVVFSGEEKVRNAIKEVEERFKPEMISVLTACVPEITGEDVTGVVEEMRGQLKCPILYISSGGCTGYQHEGVEEALVALVDQIMVPTEKRRRTVNLMGHLRPVISCRLEEIRLLSKLGLEVNAV
ncbi:MAG: nitrogenase component 1, partial [Nitrososphaeria archaeon]